MNESEIANKVLYGLKWTVIVRILGQAINWAMSIIVIRYIRPEEYGLKSMADIFMGVVAVFSAGGLESAIIHTKELTDNKLKKIFGLLIIINTTIFITLFLGANPISEYYREPKIVLLIQVMALGFLLVPLSVIPSALLSRNMEFRATSSISLITNVIGGICTLVMAIMGYGVWSLIAGPLLSNLISVIILNLYKPCIKAPVFSLHDIFDMASFGGTVVLTSLLWIAFSKADIFIAGRVLNTHEVGIYAAALHLASLPIDKIMPSLNQVAFPAYAKLRNSPEKIAKYFLKSIRLTSFILFPLSFGLVGVSHYLIPALLGEKWNDVSAILLIVGLVFPFRGISSLCAPMTNAIGKPKVQLQLVFMAFTLMIPGFIFSVNYGAIGLALTWAIIYPPIVLINVLNSTKRINLRFLDIAKAMFAPILVSSIMLAALLKFSSMNLIFVNLWITIGSMVFAGGIFYIIGVSLFARKTLYELINFFKSK